MSKNKLNISKQLKKSLKNKGSKKIVKYLKYLQINKFFKKEKHSNKIRKFLKILKKLDNNLFKELKLFIKKNYKSKIEEDTIESYSSCVSHSYSSCH